MSTPVKIFIADDDRWLLESMSDWLSSEGFAVSTAPSIEKAKSDLSRHEPDLFLCDVRFEDGDGLKFLRQVRRSHPDLPVVMMSGYAGPDAAREALAGGAFELLSKPIIDQELRTTIQRALNQKNIENENARLKEELDRRFGMESIVSHDLRMLKIFEMIDKVADTKATILITGENGTGKSMIARAIHKKSDRRKKPFVEVACGALPDNLLESELFGHVAGAFTGAIGNKTGKFLQADHGTLFLDEIGTASTALQIKLLRALQEFEFEPLGGTETISVDTRAILATNENLEKAVAEGRFRQDLFYRIQVIHIELPSLRDRLDDIPILANHFLRKVCTEYNRKISGFSNSAMNALLSHSWPGNIRELENAIQRAVLLAKSDAIEADALPSSISKKTMPSDSTTIQTNQHFSNDQQSLQNMGQTSPNIIPLSEALEGPERQIILSALKANSWNRNVTADLLGINRTTLYKKMKKLGIEEPTPQ
ncbi:MAG: sigma-54-dependent transcriptional regulator [Pirellula sp.]|jgi:DNA-binding NtrC family response regulator